MKQATIEMAERRRRKLLRRRQRELPLFEYAGVADEVEPIPDAETLRRRLQARNDTYERQLAAAAAEMQHRAAEYRSEVAKLVSADELQRLDREFWESRRPKSPEYLANYWHQRLWELRPELKAAWLDTVTLPTPIWNEVNDGKRKL